MARYFADKTPKESKKYIASFERFLKNRNGSPDLVSVVWSSEPSDLTFTNDTITNNVAYVTISGGNLDDYNRSKSIQVFMLATLSNGEIIEASAPLTLRRIKA